MSSDRARQIVEGMTSARIQSDTTGSTATERLVTRRFLLLGLAELAYFTADGVAIYALPLFVTGPVGSSTVGVGIAFGAFALSALVLRPLAGRLCDTHGRRPLLVGGAVLCSLGMLLTVTAEDLVTVVALRLLLGVAEAAFFVAAFAALADVAPPSRIGEALSYNSLGLYLGLALGPPLGERLIGWGGFSAAWVGAAALALVGTGFAVKLGETLVRAPAEPGRTPLIHRPSVPVAVGFLASIVAMAGFLAFASLHAAEVGMASASLPLFVYGSVVVVGRVAFAKVPDRLPSLPLGAGALATMGTGLTVLALWPTAAGVLTGTVALGLGVTFSTPAFYTAVFERARPSERGAASATTSMAIDLGLGGGPILLGLVAAAGGLTLAFGAAAAVAAVGCLWTLALPRHPA